jgi:predicted TIM-barrel fold metal-dependent hydrolase
MHFTPWFAPGIGRLASDFEDVPVILDHLGRAGMGTPEDYAEVLKLAKLPRVFMKFSGWRYSSKQDHPYRDAKPTVQKAYDAFGPSAPAASCGEAWDTTASSSPPPSKSSS